MNARGLMELIVINIGLRRGLIGPALFSILVLMAVITTLMAPLCSNMSMAEKRASVANSSASRQPTAKNSHLSPPRRPLAERRTMSAFR